MSSAVNRLVTPPDTYYDDHPLVEAAKAVMHEEGPTFTITNPGLFFFSAIIHAIMTANIRE